MQHEGKHQTHYQSYFPQWKNSRQTFHMSELQCLDGVVVFCDLWAALLIEFSLAARDSEVF